MPSPKKLKISIIGDSRTGKTTLLDLLMNYDEPDYSSSLRYRKTKQFNIETRIFRFTHSNGKALDVEIAIWDISDTRYIGEYLYGSDGVIVLYDANACANNCANACTVQNEKNKKVRPYLEIVANVCKTVPVAVCGNFVDNAMTMDVDTFFDKLVSDKFVSNYVKEPFYKTFLLSTRQNLLHVALGWNLERIESFESGVFTMLTWVVNRALKKDHKFRITLEQPDNDIHDSIENESTDEDIDKDIDKDSTDDDNTNDLDNGSRNDSRNGSKLSQYRMNGIYPNFIYSNIDTGAYCSYRK